VVPGYNLGSFIGSVVVLGARSPWSTSDHLTN